MRKIASWLLLCSAFVLSAGCGSEDHETNSRTNAEAPRASPRPAIPQVAIPIDLAKPPADAARTASGIVFTRRFTTTGRQPTADQVVLVRYTGWFQRSGHTFVTTAGRAQPIAIDLAHAAAGFREVIPLLHAGEKVMLWLPPNSDTRDPVAYELELIDVVASESARGAAAKPARG